MLPFLHPVERDERNREEHLALLLFFAGEGVGDFALTQLLFMRCVVSK